MIEFRTGKRFPLQLPIRVEGLEPGSVHSGETQNLSASGAYLSLDADLQVGSDVDFEMTIPAAAIGAATDVVVRCRGRVVRSGSETPEGDALNKTGVACVIDTYEFIRSKEDSGNRE